MVGEEYLRPESFNFVIVSSCCLQLLQFVLEGRDFLRFLDKLRLSFNRKLPLRFNDWVVLGEEQPKGEHESDLVASKADGLLVVTGGIPRLDEIGSEEEEEEER